MNPLIETWSEDQLLFKIFRDPRQPLDFNRSQTSARFRPIFDQDIPVATIYAAKDHETALAEVLFRGVDKIEFNLPRLLLRKNIHGLFLCSIRVRRPLKLIALHGLGLQRLNLLRGDVIDTTSVAYEATALLAQKLYDHTTDATGITWTSRQNDSSKACVLWGSRIKPQDLTLHRSPIPLQSEAGLQLIREMCVKSNFLFEG